MQRRKQRRPCHNVHHCASAAHTSRPLAGSLLHWRRPHISVYHTPSGALRAACKGEQLPELLNSRKRQTTQCFRLFTAIGTQIPTIVMLTEDSKGQRCAPIVKIELKTSRHDTQPARSNLQRMGSHCRRAAVHMWAWA